ncbi:MAG TPA: ABC transporter permease, partial [Firmicutes bacterium]|nr:ABC transporter permease [Bacillota bacterium]
PFVGLGNYLEILCGPTFWNAMVRTVYFAVVSISMEFILGISIALLLNEDFYGRWLLRSLIIIPWAIPTIVNGSLWRWIFNPQYGALNALLTQIGLIDSYQSWLGSPFLALNMVIVADVWKMTPLVVIMILAGLQTIPHELYESAGVDGANVLKRFFHITLPMLKPTILIVLILRTMETFKVFDIIYIMTSGGPANGTQLITYYTYREAFSYLQLSKGATLAFLISLTILGLSIIYVKALGTKTEY